MAGGGGGDRTSEQLLCEIERDFKALVGLIERTIAHVSTGSAQPDLDPLLRAKEAAELGANFARKKIAGR